MDARKLLLFGLLAVVIAATPGVLAATPGGATITSADKGEYPGPSTVGSLTVESGNIYNANVSTEQSTYHWAGVYGNATGKLVLGDSSSNKMYEWSAVAKYVYFDDDNSITWGNLQIVTCGNVEGVYTFLSGASDDCDSTFTTTRNYDSSVTSDSVSGAIAAQTYDDGSTAYWYTIALGDGGTSDIVFVGEADSAGHNAYNGAFSNYQVILPEDGSNGDTTTTTYYVWIELV